MLALHARALHCASAMPYAERTTLTTNTEAHVGKATDRTGMKLVDLTKDEWDQRSEALGAAEQERIDLIETKRSHNRLWNEQLIQLRDRIGQLTEEVNTKQAWVQAQTDMFAENDSGDDGEGEGEPEAEAEASGEEEETPRRRRRRRSGAAAEAVA